MARYIDADKMVAKDNAYTTFPHDLAGCDDSDLVRWINEQPTADVVPKSEVERLQEEADRYKRYFYRHDYDEMIAEAKSEVAREIFAELENHLFVIAPVEEFDGWARIQLCDLLRIKKKYTEEATP